MTDDMDDLARDVDSAFAADVSGIPEGTAWRWCAALVDLMAAFDGDGTNPLFLTLIEGVPQHDATLPREKWDDDMREWVSAAYKELGKWLARRHITFVQWDAVVGDSVVPFFLMPGAKHAAD